MPTTAAARHRAPYGLAFPLAELVYVRDWAACRGLIMTVLLDQVLDGAEFEELLLLRGPAVGRRALTIWRTAGSVVAQTAGAPPRAFSGVEPALAHFLALLRAASPRRRFALVAWVPRLWHRVALAAERHGVHV